MSDEIQTTTAVVRHNGNTAVARSGARPLIVADFLQQEAEQRRLLSQYIQQQMVEGTDYGVIPGTQNKTLLKPGAEKLTTLFRCVPQFTIQQKIENWETGLFFYQFQCQIVTQDNNTVVAEGVGSCSTYESRYRWRKQDLACPACGANAIKKSKFPPRNRPNDKPGFYCFSKAGGCGAEFDHDDTDITSQPVGRVQNPDITDCVNTVLKMAKKRAMVDASISLARCSDIFTQDVEDFDPPEPAHTPPAKQSPAPAPKQEPTQPPVEREPGDEDLDQFEIDSAEIRIAFVKDLAACKTLEELKAVGSQITVDKKELLTDADLSEMQAAYSDTSKKLKSK